MSNGTVRSAVEKTQRFQAWHLEGRGRLVGDWPLPSSLAPGQYVELGYDRAGGLVEVREYLEGHAEPLVRRPCFESGRLLYSDYSDPVSGLAGRNSYEYDVKGHLRARQEVSKEGRLRFRVEVECDAKGRIVRQRIFDGRKRLRERVDYRHDDAGRVAREDFFRDAAGTTPTGHVERVFDGRGRVLRQTWFGAAGECEHAFTYEYDELDRVIELRLLRNDVTSMVTKISFDLQGKRATTVVSDADGSTIQSERAEQKGESSPQGRASVDAEAAKSLLNVAYFYFEKGKLDRARELFETLAALLPEDPYPPLGVAATATLEGRHQTALNWYDRALGRDPNHLEALAGRSEALLHLRRVDEALESFRELFEVAGPESPSPAVRRAHAIVGQLNKALAGADPSRRAEHRELPTRR